MLFKRIISRENVSAGLDAGSYVKIASSPFATELQNVNAFLQKLSNDKKLHCQVEYVRRFILIQNMRSH